ncbi:S8 family serine peptidase [Pontiella sp. NLcol2]|uniref:S8 family serine peptidase n=2 Tax=Pontiella agarivorans TaxID=3038953 RepID=A0ABU5MZ22_9BACT|nr:S8 family serine peptidase [Pontiella agarivorans]
MISLCLLRSVAAADFSAKIDPQVRARFGKAESVRVTILCRTQLLEPPDGFGRFCADHESRGRTELRAAVITRLKAIAENGEQDAVLKAADRANAERHWIVNAVTVQLPRRTIEKIAALDEVKYVYRGFAGLPPKRSGRLSEAVVPAEREPFSVKGRNVPWNLEAIGAPRVWARKKNAGEGVVVAMLEGGVDYTHPDLRRNLWTNPGETPGNGIDDDGNGLVDDYYGYNFRTGSCEVGALTAKHHHGTVTSGIVAGDGSGGTITGVAPRARLMLLAGAGVYAYQYALEHGADVLSMSFSIPGLGDGRGLWRLMSEHAVCAGLVLVSGCGNFQQSAEIPEQIRIPEGIPCVIGAGGVDRSLKVPGFCSLGPVEWGTVKFYGDHPLPEGLIKPDVCAFPGPGYPQLGPAGEDYGSQRRGNSFSGPHIAGVAALMLSAAPELQAWRIQELMEATAKDTGPAGKDCRTGAGLIDAWAAVSAAEAAAKE